MNIVKLISNTGIKYSVENLMDTLCNAQTRPQPPALKQKSEIITQENELIERITALAAQAEPALMAGNWERLSTAPEWMSGYESQSDADLALAGRIARIATSQGVNRDELAMIVEAVFSMSGLAKRDKWQSRPDYRSRTIKKALSDIVAYIPMDTQSIIDSDVKKMYGDVLNGHKFAEYWRGRMIYVTTLNKWLKWTGA